MQVYTDDPCVAVRGSAKRCQIFASLMILNVCMLGWALSYHRAQLGKSVGWIGYTVENGCESSDGEQLITFYERA